MTALEIIMIIIGAFLVGTIFYYLFRVAGPWGSFWSFLLILILAGAASVIWIPPYGPLFYDVAWVPIVFVIVMFALLMAAATPSVDNKRNKEGNPPEYRPESKTTGMADNVASKALAAVFGIFFWFFIFFLFLVILVGVFNPPTW